MVRETQLGREFSISGLRLLLADQSPAPEAKPRGKSGKRRSRKKRGSLTELNITTMLSQCSLKEVLSLCNSPPFLCAVL